MEEKNITEQESLAIIQGMIAKTKQHLNDRSKFFFLWGFAVLVCSIAQYIMLKKQMINTQQVWIAMPIIAIIHIMIAVKDSKTKQLKTHNDMAIQSLWTALGISFFLLAFLSFRISFNIFPFLILFYGIGTFVTGKIIQFKPLIVGGIACFILSILITYITGPEQLLILALSIVVSYIIPGILLKREFKNKQNNSL
jgi:hypothetical protein